MLGTAGGTWPEPLSRRAVVFAAAVAALLWAPLPSELLVVVGRVLLIVTLATLLTWLLAPLLPRPTVGDLDRRAVLITGCSSGFGFATARALDALGVPVIAACRNPDGEGVLRLRKESSARLRVVRMDVTSDESVAAAVPAVRAALGDNELWAVVNNAGALMYGECEWMDIPMTKDIMDVNTFGEVRVTQAFLPLLRQSKGRVVNMNSLSCRIPLSGIVPYVMSKYALLAFTEALRQDMRKFGISVHSIEPWIYRTPILNDSDEKMAGVWRKSAEHVREAYGKHYGTSLQIAVDNFISMFSFSGDGVKLVADAIVDACFARDPKRRYIPAVFAQAATFLMVYVPYAYDLLHIWVLPKLKK